jgi:hypothetical protein
MLSLLLKRFLPILESTSMADDPGNPSKSPNEPNNFLGHRLRRGWATIHPELALQDVGLETNRQTRDHLFSFSSPVNASPRRLYMQVVACKATSMSDYAT